MKIKHSTYDDVSARDEHSRPLRVYLMDLWSFIPYYMARLCLALQAESVDVTLGSVRYHLDRDYFRNAGLTLDRFLFDFGGGLRSRLLRRLLKSFEYFVNIFVLGLRLVVSRPDVLHVEYLPFLERGFAFEIWFLKWVRRLRMRVVYTVHNVTRQDAPDRGIPLFRRAYKAADMLICHGEEAKTELIHRFEIAPDKIRVIPHGPLFEQTSGLPTREARARLGLDLEEPLVLSLGVISDYKGIPFLLDAWRKLKREGSDGKLLIAGTGDEQVMSGIRKKVAAEGLGDSVELRLQFVPVEQLPLFYQAADVLAYPYKAGTTSGALLTGLNYGKAVVATRLPFFQEQLTDGESALLVDYGDIPALAAALKALIARGDMRVKLASALKSRRQKSMGWEEIARKTRECYFPADSTGFSKIFGSNSGFNS